MRNAGCDGDCTTCFTYEGCEYDWKEEVEGSYKNERIYQRIL